MKVLPTTFPEVRLLEHSCFEDPRGAFFEARRASRFAAAGLPTHFDQVNVSRSGPGVLRGLHFQNPDAQDKLVTVVQGRVLDVVADVRRGSPTFGSWTSIELDAGRARSLFIPGDFAHGFLVLEAPVVFLYECSTEYSPDSERCLRWDDPRLGISWPVGGPVLSARDAAAPTLDEIPPEHLPEYHPA